MLAMVTAPLSGGPVTQICAILGRSGRPLSALEVALNRMKDLACKREREVAVTHHKIWVYDATTSIISLKSLINYRACFSVCQYA